MFLDHTQRRTTVGRTPLDEWSARHRDHYLTTHNTHNRQIYMPPVGFEPTISAGERPVAARLLRSWVRIPPGAWIFVCCECRVLSGSGLCDELITRPEESYRLCCVVVCDLETSRVGAPYIYIYDISTLRVKPVTTPHTAWTPLISLLIMKECLFVYNTEFVSAQEIWASLIFTCYKVLHLWTNTIKWQRWWNKHTATLSR